MAARKGSDERPGYVPQPQKAANPQYAALASSLDPRSPKPSTISFAQSGKVQYSKSPYSYATNPALQAGSPRTPVPMPGLARTTQANNGSFQYATPDKLQFTAKPVAPTMQPPPVRHSRQPSNSSPPHQTVQPQYNMPPAPIPPPPPLPNSPRPQGYSPRTTSAPAQSAYPPPPMGRNSRLSKERHHPPPIDVHAPPLEERSSRTMDTLSPLPGRPRSRSHSSYGDHNVVEVVPGATKSSAGKRPHSLSVGGGGAAGLAPRMDRLSVSGNRPNLDTIMPGAFPDDRGGLPPPSPLLEAYHGTYQSLSPMPHVMRFDDNLDHLEPLDTLSPRESGVSFHDGPRRAHSTSRRSPSRSREPKSSRQSKLEQDKMALQAYRERADSGRGLDRDDRTREKRRVKIYDAEQDALDLVEAMATRTVDADAIIDIIPALTHDQLLELRHEYKKHCKVQGRGINVAKHIKLKTSGNFGKIAYVTALGRYESEGYWANYWYQSNGARRELLIEALMGRQNHEIREIKDAFKDKRYSDSLVKCMDKELKADKFRKAILLALEGDRQEESDGWLTEHRNRDVDTLYNALKAKEGGESVMLQIVVLRSDVHLREVLRTYERKYQGNFAREALRKSNNLVGEVIAHILNGVINRPARDAMLLHHALMDLIEPSSSSQSTHSKHDRQQRYELLISRLVRLHWDRLHLGRVKMEYEDKYGKLVEEDVDEATKGDFRAFCIALCQTGVAR
ncbi:Annexin [Massarina eburnea CBS 473.64]|uniref:Annexin n=1 Tax=Massarina eburnea CBS 473.64 TaxID=1395130 RepID=A0A6A6S6U5_9PLEO|nr:Annexin [Massarina eburnea CBS 473.64]